MSRPALKGLRGEGSVGAPSVGRWVSEIELGARVREGTRLGRIKRAGHWMAVVAPFGVSGEVVELTADHTMVGHGDELLSIGVVSEGEGESLSEGLPDGIVALNAPMSGTLYLQPSPGAPRFASEGSKVGSSATVALIEVMKSLTPLRAGSDGVLERWLVDDASPVEVGEAIAWIGTRP